MWSSTAPADLLKLDWNESPVDFGWYQEELKRIVNQNGLIPWYPDCLALELNEEISKFVGINGNLILTFPGSDVGLETLCRAYLEPHDLLIALTPTYDNFFVYALQTGATLEQVAYQPPSLLDAEFLARCIESRRNVKAVYLTRPNNPFGYIISNVIIEELCKRFEQTMFIVDEAYIEFSDSPSCANLVERFTNIVISRTFSKALVWQGCGLAISVPLLM